MSHPCPAGCGRTVYDDDKLMCGLDWRALPTRVQNAVHHAWRHGRGRGTVRLLKAQQEAVAWLKHHGGPVKVRQP